MSFSYKFIWLALSLSIALGIAIYCWAPLYLFEGFNKALDGVLLMSSISLGFYGACLGVFASIFNTKPVRQIMSDNDYKKEFIVISLITLGSSFLTVFNTIIYQVLLENSNIINSVYRIMNVIWAISALCFIFFNVLFVLVVFMIFFSNNDDKNNKSLDTVNGKEK